MPFSLTLGTLTSWNPLGHSRPVTGLLYLFILARCCVISVAFFVFRYFSCVTFVVSYFVHFPAILVLFFFLDVVSTRKSL